MKNILEYLRTEWEIAILAVVLLLLGIWGIASLLNGNEKSKGGVTNGLMIYQDEDDELDDEEKISDDNTVRQHRSKESEVFVLPKWMRKEKPKNPPSVSTVVSPSPAPAEPVTTERAPMPKPVPAKEVTPEIVQKPAQMSQKPFKGKLYFSEIQDLPDGMTVALIQLQIGSEDRVVTLAQGETAYGLTLQRLEKKQIVVLDAQKRVILLKAEEECPVWIFEEM